MRVDGERSYLCLAITRDGTTWEKPSLGLIDFDGSRNNNMIADIDRRRLCMCYMFPDPRSGIPQDERVKAIVWTDGHRYCHWSWNNQVGLKRVLLGSANGEVFHEIREAANSLRSDRFNAFDGGCVFWSEEEQLFVAYFRWWDEMLPIHAP